MLLGTAPGVMPAAYRLSMQMGFVERPPYNGPRCKALFTCGYTPEESKNLLLSHLAHVNY